ncbi:MAG: nitroreductase family protein [Acidimicrobiales bacterium]
MTAEYQHPYPPVALEAAYPFVEYQSARFSEAEMLTRGKDFYAEVDQRRSVRMFSDAPVSRELIELAVKAASTAPSGAHKQPWTFVATQDPAVKAAIREAAEEEERVNYLENRMNEEWREALGPLSTDHHKEFLEIARG